MPFRCFVVLPKAINSSHGIFLSTVKIFSSDLLYLGNKATTLNNLSDLYKARKSRFHIQSEQIIKGEFKRNGFKNELKHEAGVLSMARSMMPNSAGSQFFIMHKNAPHLDGDYAAFGKVIEGMDVVDKIANVPTDSMDRPLDDQRMKSVTVDTHGIRFPEPIHYKV